MERLGGSLPLIYHGGPWGIWTNEISWSALGIPPTDMSWSALVEFYPRFVMDCPEWTLPLYITECHEGTLPLICHGVPSGNSVTGISYSPPREPFHWYPMECLEGSRALICRNHLWCRMKVVWVAISVVLFVMPQPLGAGGIMFSGCPSVSPSEAWNTLFWPVHGSVGPPDQPLPFYGMSVRLSVQRGFRAFARECMEGLAWNFTCWCILTIFRTDKFMVMVCWFFLFWHYFDLVKWVKFGVSGHFPENAWREWPEILHADVSWPSSELISL